MTTASEYLSYRRLRAPEENGTGFFEPPPDRVGELVDANARSQAETCYDVQGKCLNRLAHEAREELLDAARRWTASYRDLGEWAWRSSNGIFLAGHQPQLFHPGVWLKNFALGRLAERHGAVGVNLIVDSDTIRSNTIRVPGGSLEAPTLVNVPFDRAGPAVPYEERRILDHALFARFSEEVEKQIKPLVPNPIVTEYWHRVQERARFTDRLGLCLAQARHVLEGRWGGHSLELPQSAVCDSQSYRWFLCHLLHEADRFRRAHNEVLGIYRRSHRIRSLSHPAPDLAEQDDWHETPFWIWTFQNPRRRRLFVRRQRHTLRLTNQRELNLSLPLSADGDAAQAVESLGEHSQNGVRIRSRALVTTMWARLALGDLFLHGIGGAKYDQVTDGLIARFFNLDPPGYVTVSGTLHLPVPHPKGAADKVRRQRERLRRLKFQPERFLDELSGSEKARIGEARQLAGEKWDWIRRNVTPANYRERFLEIRRLNERLQPWVEPLRERTLQELKEAQRASRTAEILTRRDYAFCLFPAEELQDFFAGLLPKRA